MKKEHLQWLYRKPNYFIKKNKWGGKREKNKIIVKIHEKWAKKNGYRDKKNKLMIDYNIG
jgi:hypothetical protein|tara:strand:+ start:281 stop:460 length:180 start_codon:yes stop_codon:yes gene_type:complete